MNINRPLRDLLYKWILYYLHVKKINDHLEFSLEQHLKFLVTTNITKNVIFMYYDRNLPQEI